MTRIKTQVFRFNQGSIEGPYNKKDRYYSCEMGGLVNCENRPTYLCSWGSGYEYDSAQLCKPHLEEAVVQLQRIISELP